MSGPRRRGEAGRAGEGVRADLHVRLELRERGGVEVRFVSAVEAERDAAVSARVRGALARLGVAHAAVDLDDREAPDFAIDARVETAARRAGVVPAAGAIPARTAPLPPPSPRDRLRRSRLYVPGSEPARIAGAGRHGSDAVILDLEDSVAPEEKDAARLLVRNAFRAVDLLGAERMVRINPFPLGLEDLEAIVPVEPDVILVPKVEEAEQVRAVDRVIDEIADRSTDRAVWLMPILESAIGVENALAVARASPRVAAITIGLEDYAEDLGTARTAEGGESLWARARLVNAARAAGIQPIDSVYGDLADLEGLARWARRSRALGFEGMGCTHPRQVAVIHDAFSPSSAEIARAFAIVATFEQAAGRGAGVTRLGSTMIDPPVVARARRLLERARELGLIPPGPLPERTNP